MYRITNRTGGQLVCTLADGKTTLRVDNKKTAEVDAKQVTDHLRNLEKKGLVVIAEHKTAKPAASATETK